MEKLGRLLGVSRQTVFRYENGKIENIPRERLEKIAAVLGISPSRLFGWEDALGILPIERRRVPMVGEIACGKPIYASEEHESFASADERLDADFCLKAHGDSMVGARIYDGDIVFIRSQNSVDNGEIAAVIINDEATLKRVYYYPNEEKLILSPENPKYPPLVYIKEELNTIKIIGKAVAFQSVII
jgi:repressor LexA